MCNDTGQVIISPVSGGGVVEATCPCRASATDTLNAIREALGMPHDEKDPVRFVRELQEFWRKQCDVREKIGYEAWFIGHES